MRDMEPENVVSKSQLGLLAERLDTSPAIVQFVLPAGCARVEVGEGLGEQPARDSCHRREPTPDTTNDIRLYLQTGA